MFKNYLKTSLRNLGRHKLYSFINIFGLAVGLAFVITIYLFIRHELSFDRFHEHTDRIFRVNEVAYFEIRKVLGASLHHILILLNRDLVRLSLLALLIAAPLGWYAMRQWLENFEYKIELGWPVFAVTGLAVLLVTIITVSYHSMRAAMSNPADALKYE